MRSSIGWSFAPCVLTFVLGGPPVAVADDSVARIKDKAKEHVARGDEAYKNGKFVEAAQAYLYAYELAESGGLKPFPELLYNAGLAFEQLGECDQVAELFGRYLTEIPEAATPELKERVEAARRCAPEVLIVTTPPSAIVEIDGKMHKRRTPLRLHLRAGAHSLRLSLSDHLPIEEALNVEEGKPLALDRKLVSPTRMGKLQLHVLGESDVRVDGRPVGKGPFRVVLDLREGSHTLLVEQSGCMTGEFRVDIPGTGEPVPWVVRPPCGPEAPVSFDIPLTSKVLVNGRPLDGPFGKRFLPSGKHHVRIEVPGCGVREQDVTVPESGAAPPPVITGPAGCLSSLVQPVEPSSGAVSPWVWVAGGVGAVGLAGGVAFAIMAGQTGPNEEGGLEAGAKISFATAAIGLIGAGVLYLTTGDSAEP